jgi:UDP-2,4-diacetamido-2,4,6-trideoxy-beta-L-altropyranose hydrolase
VTDLLILADGGGDIGFGHLMRCLAIRHVWNNGTARLLAQMKDDEPTPNGAENFDWLRLPEKLKEYMSTNTLLLVDSYRPDEEYFRLLKTMFPFVAVLDDYNRISYPVDMVICPGVYGKEMDYSNQLAVTLGGAKYVILRAEILTARKLKKIEPIKTILVTLGGSQQDEILFQQLIDILENTGYKAIVVTGNGLLAKKLHGKKSQIYGKLEPLAMANIMASVDVAVSAAGQTQNELAWLGVPTFSIKTGEDQHENWTYYKNHNLSLGAELANAQNLKSTLIEILSKETAESRLKRTKKLMGLLTATGASTICSVIENSGSKVHA